MEIPKEISEYMPGGAKYQPPGTDPLTAAEALRYLAELRAMHLGTMHSRAVAYAINIINTSQHGKER